MILYSSLSGKMNQGFTFYREDKKSVGYEIRLDKFHLLKASEYTFIDRYNLREEKHLIGKTVSSSVSVGGFSTQTNVKFKLDGVNIWDILHDKKLDFTFSMANILKPEYTLKRNGQIIGKMSSISPKEVSPDKKVLFNMHVPGFYRLEIIDEEMNLDVLALIYTIYIVSSTH